MKLRWPRSESFLFKDAKIQEQFRQRWSKGNEMAAWYLVYKVVICTFYLANIAYTWYKHDKDHGGTPNAWKNISDYLLLYSWFFSTAIYSLALMVTVLFWSLLYEYKEAPSYSNLFVHLLQSVVVLIDQLVSRRQWRPLTAWASIPVPMVWLIFSLIYWAVGGTNNDGDNYIYPVLKWGEAPGQAVGVTFLALVALPLIHCALALLTKLR